MKEIIHKLRNWVLFWIWLLVTLWVWVFAYERINQVQGWELLQSETFNKLIDNDEYFNWEIKLLSWMIVAFAKESCPEWWEAADWENWKPDLRWIFIRWANNFWSSAWTNDRDSDRLNSSEGILTYQEDGIRNITGEYETVYMNWTVSTKNKSAVYKSTTRSASVAWTSGANLWGTFSFDASRSVWEEHTWADNRPKNLALIYCIKK